MVYKGGKSYFIEKFTHLVKNIFAVLLWYTMYLRKLSRIDIKYIHINSLTLWPLLLMIPKKYKTIIHCREILDEKSSPIYCKFVRYVIIKRSDLIIAIDKLTAEPFEPYTSKVKTIDNPFDMCEAKNLKYNSYHDICKKYNLDPSKSYVSLVGNIQHIKGHTFYLEFAKEFIKNDRYIFLIVGDGRGEYAETIKYQLGLIPNIVWLGYVELIEEIYAITHTLVRCEDYLPLGRTVWEAYYSGCNILLPYREYDNVQSIINNDGFYLYKANDLLSFKDKLKQIELDTNGYKNKYLMNRPCDNINKAINEFIKCINVLY